MCVRYSDIQLRSLPRALDLRAIAPCVLDLSRVSSVPPYTYRHGYLCRYILSDDLVTPTRYYPCAHTSSIIAVYLRWYTQTSNRL